MVPSFNQKMTHHILSLQHLFKYPKKQAQEKNRLIDYYLSTCLPTYYTHREQLFIKLYRPKEYLELNFREILSKLRWFLEKKE